MGNRQSNEWEKISTTRDKIFKVERKDTSKELFLKFKDLHNNENEQFLEELENDDLIYYMITDRQRKVFAISCVNRAPFNTYQVGDYAEINLNTQEEYGINLFSSIVFNDSSKIRKIEGAWEDSNGNVRDLKGNPIELLSSIGETIEGRQRFVAAIEQSRHATNHAWTKQTSWDMPPGWK